MMKRLLLSTLLWTLAVLAYAGSGTLDSLYRCLDKEIQKSDEYIQARQTQIGALYKRYQQTRNPMTRHQIAWDLYKGYGTFINDSALHYLGECINLSKEMNQSGLLQSDYIALAHQYAAAGFYNEALKYLHIVDRRLLKGQQLVDYKI